MMLFIGNLVLNKITIINTGAEPLLQNVAKVHFYCNSIGGLQRENATAFSLALYKMIGV